jgi:hypothetical protein
MFLPLPPALTVNTVLPQWNGVILGFTCLVQFAVSMMMDSRYEKGHWREYFWVIWYPLVFWLINMLTTVVAVPKALLKRRGERAVWVSPCPGRQTRSFWNSPSIDQCPNTRVQPAQSACRCSNQGRKPLGIFFTLPLASSSSRPLLIAESHARQHVGDRAHSTVMRLTRFPAARTIAIHVREVMLRVMIQRRFDFTRALARRCSAPSADRHQHEPARACACSLSHISGWRLQPGQQLALRQAADRISSNSGFFLRPY